MKRLMVLGSKQRGISLVEIAIATAVVAAILIGVLVALPKIQFERQMAVARSEIPVTVSALHRSYAGQLDTTGASTKIMVNMSAWPWERVRNRGNNAVTVDGPFPGSGETVVSNVTTAAPRLNDKNQGFVYYFTNLPPEACLPLLQILATQRPIALLAAGAATTATLTGTINPAMTTVSVSNNANGALTLNMENAATACQTNSKKQIAALISRA